MPCSSTALKYSFEVFFYYIEVPLLYILLADSVLILNKQYTVFICHVTYNNAIVRKGFLDVFLKLIFKKFWNSEFVRLLFFLMNFGRKKSSECEVGRRQEGIQRTTPVLLLDISTHFMNVSNETVICYVIICYDVKTEAWQSKKFLSFYGDV